MNKQQSKLLHDVELYLVDVKYEFIHLNKENENLKKALDKVCQKLFEEMATVKKGGKRVFMKSEEEWKAWALKDE